MVGEFKNQRLITLRRVHQLTIPEQPARQPLRLNLQETAAWLCQPAGQPPGDGGYPAAVILGANVLELLDPRRCVVIFLDGSQAPHLFSQLRVEISQWPKASQGVMVTWERPPSPPSSFLWSDRAQLIHQELL